MPKPVLIDTDMGVDDAVALTLALNASELELVGIVSVGGNVSLEQATANIGRLLAALETRVQPLIGRGLDQASFDLEDATHVHGHDGLGGLDLPVSGGPESDDYLDVYERLIEQHGDALNIVAIGPLTNLAGVLREKPGLLERVGQVVIMGGAIWCKGNVTPTAEFNFYRDPQAAADLLASGIPITVVPLDVTRQVELDESHVAHLSASGTGRGELLARMIRYPLEQPTADGGVGTCLVHDALAVGVLIWPQLFMRSKMALEVITAGDEAGRCKPRVARDKKPLGVVISVQRGEFVENMLERLCNEKFVV